MIRAMIFDLDGTLVQTEKLKALSYAKAAVALRPELRAADVIEAYKAVVGRSRHAVARHLLDRFGLETAARRQMAAYAVKTPWQAYIQIRLGLYDAILSDPEILVKNQWPHTIDLLNRAAESCPQVGLATMSACAQVQRVLKILRLEKHFDFVASRDDVEKGKPDPEIYLLVARQLDTPAAQCLVIEDSPTGVQAALAAGMACIAVTTPFTRDALHAAQLLEERWIVDSPATLPAVVAERVAQKRGPGHGNI
ncbi:MAG: HAD family phosphatase [Desulfosarcinaceae bacterium]|nr:HAD family phosphatase [Desulfosarcinaceae bacterium]